MNGIVHEEFERMIGKSEDLKGYSYNEIFREKGVKADLPLKFYSIKTV